MWRTGRPQSIQNIRAEVDMQEAREQAGRIPCLRAGVPEPARITSNQISIAAPARRPITGGATPLYLSFLRRGSCRLSYPLQTTATSRLAHRARPERIRANLRSMQNAP